MRLHRPEIAEHDESVRLSSRIEVSTRCNVEFPDRLWFEFPASYRDWISDRADAFVSSLLPLAMFLGESLEVEGALSPRLLRGLSDYQSVQVIHSSRMFQRVDIRAESVVVEDEPTLQATGCAFSGGVDSFYSLRRHLGEAERVEKYRLSHLLMISGFGADGDRDEGRAMWRIAGSYGSMAEALGLDLLVVRTNLLAVMDMSVLRASFGSALAASAQALGRLFSRFYIPSSLPFHEDPSGSALMLDHLLATETLEIIHDAPEQGRLAKLGELVGWSETYSRLRVCFEGTDLARDDGRIVNCCRCEKCTRTMVGLEIFGALNRYDVFPHRLRHRDVWFKSRRNRRWRVFPREAIREAWARGRFGIALSTAVSLGLSYLGSLLYEPLRALHLALERRFAGYSGFMDRHHPFFQQGRRWIRKPRSSTPGAFDRERSGVATR